MKINFKHTGKYTGNNFTIEEVISSLSAQKDLIRSGAYLLEHIDSELSIDEVKIYIDRLETSSVVWDIVVEVYAAYQNTLEEKAVKGIEGMFGIDVPTQYEPLVGLAALAVTYVVTRYAYERVAKSKGDSTPSVHISGEGNVVIQNIAQIVNQSPEAIENALEKAVPPAKRKSLLPRVADFLRPAKSREGAHIEMTGAPPISAEALREFPTDADLAGIDDRKNIDVEGAKLEIRATDRDKKKTGWSAKIIGDDRFPKRLPMDLYPTIDAGDLASHHFVKANLFVECEKVPGDGLKPKRIHIFSYEPFEE